MPTNLRGASVHASTTDERGITKLYLMQMKHL